MPTVETSRGDVSITRVVNDPLTDLTVGQSRLRVDAFGLSANNVTYAVFGDMLRYWEVFPAPEGASDWGRVPVWGFAEVIETRSDALALGERLFGLLPISEQVIITPGRADDSSISDVAEHRAGLFGTYNRYVRAAADPIWRADRENQQMLMYPLFVTGFVIDDFLLDQGDFAAEQLVVSSASSKTALAVAHAAHQRGARVIGLTSPNNFAMVAGLGIYSEVLTYEQINQLDTVPSVFIDIAGNSDVVHAVHQRLEGNLGHSMIVGNTNWNHSATTTGELPGPAPEFFFAPTQIARRTKEWGSTKFAEHLAAGWNGFADWTDTWITFKPFLGTDQAVEVLRQLTSGQSDPSVGHIGSLTDASTA